MPEKRRNTIKTGYCVDLNIVGRLKSAARKHRYSQVSIVERALEKELSRLEKLEPVL